MEQKDRFLGDQDTAHQLYGNGQSERLDENHGLQPRSTVPPTVLVTELNTGALILRGRPEGPRAYLAPDDAVPLKRGLAAAFERAELTSRDDLDEAR